MRLPWNRAATGEQIGRGAGFALILVVAIVGSGSRAHAVVPAAEPTLAAQTIAPVTGETFFLPAVERHNEVARADMQVVRLEPVVIFAKRSEIAAARAQRSAPASVASSTAAANVATAVR